MLAKDQHAALRLIHVVDLTMAYSAIEAAYVFECRNAMETGGKKVVADCSASARAAGIEPDSKCVVTLVEHIYDVIENEATTWGGRRGCDRHAWPPRATPSVIGQRRGGPHSHFEQAGAAYSRSVERKKGTARVSFAQDTRSAQPSRWFAVAERMCAQRQAIDRAGASAHSAPAFANATAALPG
jgi:hypothetical protein